jgi:hypothetical protein
VYSFTIAERTNALNCFRFFIYLNKNKQIVKSGKQDYFTEKELKDLNEFLQTDQFHIKYIKDEAVFVKFGDEEAALYEKKLQQKQAEENTFQRSNAGRKETRREPKRYNEDIPKEKAE